MHVYQPRETADHMRQIEGFLLRGVSINRIAEVMLADPKVRISRKRVIVLAGRVKERWAAEDQDMRGSWKGAAIRRIQNWITRALGEDARYDERGNLVRRETKINHSAIARYEHLLADIQGTREPLKLDMHVEHTEAIAAVIMDMTEQELLEAAREQDERERAFEICKRERLLGE